MAISKLGQLHDDMVHGRGWLLKDGRTMIYIVDGVKWMGLKYHTDATNDGKATLWDKIWLRLTARKLCGR